MVVTRCEPGTGSGLQANSSACNRAQAIFAARTPSGAMMEVDREAGIPAR
jgi:hypothetical protein